jgi:hypothetical protein
LAQEVLVWVAKSGHDLVLLLLDFEKNIWQDWMGLPLPNLVQTGFLPHLDSMDLLPLLARVLISQSKQGTWRGLQTCQVGQAKLHIGSIPVHPCNGCFGPYAGRP